MMQDKPHEPNTELHLCGQGTLRFLGIIVYEASLFCDANFVASKYWMSSTCLSIRYQRALAGDLLLERSMIEMESQTTLPQAKAKQWRAQLAVALPNVQAGDVLAAEHDGKGGLRFRHNQTTTIEIEDIGLARWFLGIWLSETSTAPSLRQDLLGSYVVR